jgi:hypothetical protein
MLPSELELSSIFMAENQTDENNPARLSQSGSEEFQLQDYTPFSQTATYSDVRSVDANGERSRINVLKYRGN